MNWLSSARARSKENRNLVWGFLSDTEVVSFTISPCCCFISAKHRPAMLFGPLLPLDIRMYECFLWGLIISTHSIFLHTLNITFFYSKFNPSIMSVSYPWIFYIFMQHFEFENYINENNFRSLHKYFPLQVWNIKNDNPIGVFIFLTRY